MPTTLPANATLKDAASAQRWAEELTAEFSRRLGHACPFAIEPSLDQYGAERLTVAGVVLASNYRNEHPTNIALFVAARLACPRSPFAWFDWPFAMCGFINWMIDEHYTNDPDGRRDWLDEFGRNPAKWTIEYIAHKAAVAG